MSKKKQLSILEFSRLTGIKRENLRFYDRIGLLSPEMRGINNYRYYSRHQLNTAYLISNLRGLGVGIEEIKQYSIKRTPQKALELFARQQERIQTEIGNLQKTLQIMQLHAGMVAEALQHDKNAIFLEKKEQESIFLCPPIPPRMNTDEGEIFSYEYADSNGVNLGSPLGTIISQERLESGDTGLGDRYYFKGSTVHNAIKPAGLYAVAYGRCDPWKTEALHLRLLNFIKKQNLRICGCAYEEYPLSDLSVQKINQYGIRMEIPVMTS